MKHAIDGSPSPQPLVRYTQLARNGAMLLTAMALAMPTAARATPGCTASATVSCFLETGSIVTYTVPDNGTYVFLAYGAQGGNSGRNIAYTGGLGAELAGSFDLLAGDVLQIGVGQSGRNALAGAGGGGGSFVVLTGGPDDLSASLIPLLIASGGGGGSTAPGSGGSATINAILGGGGGNGGAAGTGGNGASHTTGANAAGGGAGFFSDGAANNTGFTTGGRDFANGLAGGTTGNSSGGSGGFGGGGGGSGPSGGGGGYNGGGGGFNGGNGGGGGSYFEESLNGTPDPTMTFSGVNSGNGLVVITGGNGGQDSTPVLEPASFALVGSGVVALGSVRRRPRARVA